MERFPTVLLPSALQSVSRDSEQRYQVLNQTVRPAAPHSRPPRGHSESQFEQDLWRYFPGKIHTGMMMMRADGATPYVPDFAYIDPDCHLHIDIEIDEPYTYDTRQPLHYLNCTKDQQRNQAFLNWGWVIIRFSEAQIVQAPASCCKTIASLVATLTDDNCLMSAFRSVPTLKPERRWTKLEAQQMAAVNYRARYLAPPQPIAKSRKRKSQPSPRSRSVVTTHFTFYCPACGEGPIRWQGHYICCPNCRYDAFAL
ncbi:MAG: DUF559 domain-containing protein [Synechococcales cyanobacterium M58_A2018_015]|nr:DUF559 domain-containing protein [Synechococcales cyanobacterium M58_A2018_015]